MRDEILSILTKAHSTTLTDSGNSVLSAGTVECLRRGVQELSAKKATQHTCPDEGCRVAFWLEIEQGSPYCLVVEVSKLGHYARAYWKRKAVFSVEYSSALPPENRPSNAAQLQVIEKLLSVCGVVLLSLDELTEEVPFEADEYNPEDNSTVGSLLFAPEYH